MVQVRNVAAFVSGTASPASVTKPTTVNGDLLLMLMEYGTGAGTNHVTAAGWTELLWRDQVAATGRTDLTLMGRIADGSEGASVSFTIAGTVNHWGARMMSIQDHGLSVIGDVVLGTTTGGAAGGASPQDNTGIPGITVTAGSLIVLCGVSARDANWTGTEFSLWAATDPASLTEQIDNGTLSGNGGGVGAATGICAGTTTGNGSYRQATLEAWNAGMIGIKDVVAGGGIPTALMRRERRARQRVH